MRIPDEELESTTGSRSGKTQLVEEETEEEEEDEFAYLMELLGEILEHRDATRPLGMQLAMNLFNAKFPV